MATYETSPTGTVLECGKCGSQFDNGGRPTWNTLCSTCFNAPNFWRKKKDGSFYQDAKKLAEYKEKSGNNNTGNNNTPSPDIIEILRDIADSLKGILVEMRNRA